MYRQMVNAYEVDALNPVVLVGGHTQLRQNVVWSVDLDDFDVRGILIVDLGPNVSEFMSKSG